MPKYRLVRHAGEDTLHLDPAFENCNLDDSENDVRVDLSEDAAWELVTGGSTHACQYCFPLPQELVSGPR